MTPRRILSRVTAWWLSRRVERRNPELAALRKAEADARRRHKPTKPFQEARKALVEASLRAELGVKP